MLKPALTLAAAAAAGVVLWKVLSWLLLPLLGLAATLLKIALVVGLIWAGLWIFRKRPERPKKEGEQPAE